MRKKGIFITLEGPEGSGKSTQLRLLAEHLKRRGFSLVITREPGGTAVSVPLRNLLLRTRKNITSLAELMLYEADRAQHMQEVVLPALRRKRTVLCDRHSDSTMAYQGYGRGLDKGMVTELNRIATQGRKPDLTILLDVPADVGLRRAAACTKGHDRLEKAGISFHRKVRLGFLAIARKEPRRVRVISHREGVSQTQECIREIVDEFLKKR